MSYATNSLADTKPDTPHFLALGGIDHTYRALIDLGAEYSLIQSKNLVTEYQIKSAREVFLTDYENVELMLAYARTIHRQRPINYVLSLSEYPQLAAARIAEALQVPTNCDLHAVENTRDKYLFRQLMERAGLPSVPFRLVHSVAELQAFYNEVGGRIVVKPVSGAGSEGVRFAGDASELEAAFFHASRVKRGGVLAEKYIGGHEYSVETMSRDGRHEIAAVTRKTVGGLPYFVEMGHVQPWSLDAQQAELTNIVERMLNALGHVHGPAHTEIKIEDGAIHLIETQVRLGGDQIWEMTMLSSGVDVTRETLCALLGLERPARAPRHNAVAIRFFALPQTTLSKEALREVASGHENVIRAHIDHANAGKTTPSHSGERSGYVLVHGDSADEAERVAEQRVAHLLAAVAA